MYVDSVYAKKFQEVAKLLSPMTTTPMSGCLSFYYKRNQAQGNYFSLLTKDELGHYEELWRPDAYATPNWKLEQVDIKAPHPLEVSQKSLHGVMSDQERKGEGKLRPSRFVPYNTITLPESTQANDTSN